MGRERRFGERFLRKREFLEYASALKLVQTSFSEDLLRFLEREKTGCLYHRTGTAILYRQFFKSFIKDEQWPAYQPAHRSLFGNTAFSQ